MVVPSLKRRRHPYDHARAPRAHVVPLALVVVGLVSALAGCPGIDVPVGARIGCTEDAQCPAGFECRPALGLCVEQASADRRAPGVTSTTIEPAVARIGTTVLVHVQTDEALHGPPALAIALDADRRRPLVVVADDDTATSFTGSYAAAGDEPEGEVAVSGTFVDVSGNSAVDLALGVVRFDFTPPTLTALDVSPTIAKADTIVRVLVRSSEPLADDVEVRLPGGRALDSERPGVDPLERTFTLVVDNALDAEGPLALLIDARDPAGNPAQRVLEDALVTDFTPPALDGDVVIAQPAVRAGQRAVVVARFTEPVTASLELVPEGGGASLPMQLDARAGREQTFRADVEPTTPTGRYAVHVSSWSDAAGNASLPLLLDAHIVIDGTAPRFVVPPVASPAFVSRVAGRDAFAVSFTVDEDLDVLAALDGIALPCAPSGAALSVVWTCAHAVDATDVEGAHGITVQLVDGAGNTAFAATSVTFDFTPPTLLSSSASPAFARAGDVVIYTLTPSETLVGAPALELAGPTALNVSVVPGTAFSYSSQITTALPGGSYAATTTMEDLAGNVAVAAGVSVAIDTVSPTIGAVTPSRTLLGPAAAFSHSDITFRATDDQPGLVLDVHVGARAIACAGGPDFTCPFDVQTSDPEGALPILVVARDATGNSASASSVLALDRTPPAVLGSVVVNLTPGTGNPLAAPTRVTAGTTVRLAFTMSEPLGSDPVVTTTGTPSLAFTVDAARSANPGFQVTHTLATAPAQGSLAVQLVATDVVGNVATVPLTLQEPGFVVDTIAPVVPSVNVVDRIVYTRAPWGDATGTRVFRVDGGAASVEASTTVIAWDGGTVASAGEIGRARADATGAFGMALSTGDRTSVFLTSVDDAGNVSDGSAALTGIQGAFVRDADWIATMGGKLVGSNVENPHRFETRRFAERTFEQADGEEVAGAGPGRVGGTVTTTAGAPAWRELRSTATGSGRVRAAYDDARGVVVMVGGPTGVLEWDGTRWNAVAVRDPEGDGDPVITSDYALVYDRARGNTVLFGAGVFSGETWTWNGRSWTLAARADSTGVTAPLPRNFPAMAFFPVDGVVVLFGGEDNSAQVSPCAFDSSACLDDTWEWDGSSWIDMGLVGAGPTARAGAAMAFDDANQTMVVFGGVQAGPGSTPVMLSDTLAFDGGSWARLAASGPPARARAAIVADPLAGGVTLHGGIDDNTGLSFADEWLFDGSRWSQRTLLDPEVDGSPSARSEHVIVADLARDTLLLVGGQGAACNVVGGGFCDDTWTRTSATASWRRVGAIVPATSLPTTRLEAGATFDRTRGAAVMFGGLNGAFGNPVAVACGSTTCGDLWELRGAQWSQRSQLGQLLPPFFTTRSETPSPRRGAAVAYDEVAQRTVVVGGVAAANCDGGATTLCNGTYLWNGGTGTWFRGANGPSARAFAALAYDVTRNRTVLFGGEGASNSSNGETWEWNGSSWTQRCLAGACGAAVPPARRRAAMGYDRVRQRIVLFGGLNFDNDSHNVFEFNGTTWSRIVPSDPEGDGSPNGIRDQARFVFDERRGKLVYFGQPQLNCESTSTLSCDALWEWNGTSWKALGLPASPSDDGVAPPREGAGFAFDPGVGEGLLYAGRPGVFDTWRYDGGARSRPAHVMHVDFSAAGVPSAFVRGLTTTWVAGATSELAGVATQGISVRALAPDGTDFLVVQNTVPASAPASVVGTIAAGSTIMSAARTFTILAEPRGDNGTLTGFASIATDYAELRVRYRQ